MDGICLFHGCLGLEGRVRMSNPKTWDNVGYVGYRGGVCGVTWDTIPYGVTISVLQPPLQYRYTADITNNTLPPKHPRR